tara:strand:- start:579 stop:749 length:171 start_codon:yes stop_codon:yes gene_type:complete
MPQELTLEQLERALMQLENPLLPLPQELHNLTPTQWMDLAALLRKLDDEREHSLVH